jgi:hypothetical protein
MSAVRCQRCDVSGAMSSARRRQRIAESAAMLDTKHLAGRRRL